MKMQSLFHPVWMSPNRNHVCFYRKYSKKLDIHRIFNPFFCSPKNTIIPEQAIHHTRYRYRDINGGQALSLLSYYECFLFYRFKKRNLKIKKLFFYLCQIPCIHLVPVYETPERFDKLHPVILVV